MAGATVTRAGDDTIKIVLTDGGEKDGIKVTQANGSEGLPTNRKLAKNNGEEFVLNGVVQIRSATELVFNFNDAVTVDAPPVFKIADVTVAKLVTDELSNKSIIVTYCVVPINRQYAC